MLISAVVEALLFFALGVFVGRELALWMRRYRAIKLRKERWINE